MGKLHRIPPGPAGRWLTGNIKDFISSRLDFLTDCASRHGDLCAFRLGRRSVYLVNHPDLIEQVLVTDASRYIKHFGARVYKPILGTGLVTSEGNFWLRQRRLSQPAFLRSRLNAYADPMVELTQRMLRDDWRPGRQVDIHLEMNHLTSGIALKTLFGMDEGPDKAAYTDSLKDAFQILGSRIRRLIPVPNWFPTPANIRLWRAQSRLRGLVDGFIRAGRARKEPGNDLLSRLIAAQDTDGTRMTDEQLRDEAMTIYLAGHETTALTLSWTWYALSQHPSIEARLVEEWQQVLGGRQPRSDDLDRLSFTEQVIQESMRLYPPVYLIGREAISDCQLGNFDVPRGTTVFISQWVTQRDPRFFENPLEFRPERWSEGLMKQLPKYAYFPFGGGPRVCIGNGFAMMEAVLLLATIGQAYRFTLDPKPEVNYQLGITLLPKDGIPATLVSR